MATLLASKGFNMTLVEQIIYDDELSHYGVLGMKWGVRKDRRKATDTSAILYNPYTDHTRIVTKTSAATPADRLRMSNSAAHITEKISNQLNNPKSNVNTYVDTMLKKNTPKYGPIADWPQPVMQQYVLNKRKAIVKDANTTLKPLFGKNAWAETYRHDPNTIVIGDAAGIKYADKQDYWFGVKHADEEEGFWFLLRMSDDPKSTELTVVAEGSMNYAEEGFINHNDVVELIQTIELGQDELSHHGVKGMKWGIRKDRSGRVSAKTTLSGRQQKKTAHIQRVAGLDGTVKDAKTQLSISKTRAKQSKDTYKGAKKAFKNSKKTSGRFSRDRRTSKANYKSAKRALSADKRQLGLDKKKLATTKTLAKPYEQAFRKASPAIKKSIKSINNNPKFANQNFKKDSPLRREYYSAISKSVTTSLNAASKNKLSFSYNAATDSIPTAKFVSGTPSKVKIKHADESHDVELVWDDKGYLIDIVLPGELSHVEQIIYGDELTHYGVLGMKWGVRKARPTSNKSSQKTGSSDGKKKTGSDPYEGVDKGKKKQNIIQPRSSNLSKASTKSIIESNNRRSAQDRQAVNKAKVVRNQRGTKLKRLSDADLSRSISRIQQEKQYRELNQSTTQKLIKEIGREVSKKQIVKALDAGITSLIASSVKKSDGSSDKALNKATDALAKATEATDKLLKNKK